MISKAPRRRRIAIALVVLTLLAVALVLLRRNLPDAAALRSLLETLGAVPLPIYVAIYAGMTVATAPLAVMIGTGGAILGFEGIPVVMGGALLGAAAAFALTRFFFRERASRLLCSDKRLAAVERAVEEDAFRLTVLVRLSPVMPFGLYNYLAGAMPMGPLTFLSASFLGLFVRVTLGVFLAQGAKDVALSEGDLALSPERIALYAFSVVVTLLVLAWVGRTAQAALRAAGVGDDEESSTPEVGPAQGG